MPTYQYSCTDCGHFFEIVQSFSEDSLTVCPECEGRLRKVFNAVGVVFKGSGFYRNDSRAKQSGDGATSGSSESATKTETGGSTPTDASSSSGKTPAKSPEKGSSAAKTA